MFNVSSPRFAPLAVVAAMFMSFGTAAIAQSVELIGGPPKSVFKRTDGNWYLKASTGWEGITFGTAKRIDVPFAPDQVAKFVYGEVYLLKNGELWTARTDIASRLWQATAPAGKWYRVHTNAKDWFIASDYANTYDKGDYLLYVLTKDGKVQVGVKTGGYVDVLPGKVIEKMAHQRYVENNYNGSYTRNLHFFGTDGVIYSTNSYYGPRPWTFDANGKLLSNDSQQRIAWKKPLTQRMTNAGFTRFVDAIERIDAWNIYTKTGEVFRMTTTAPQNAWSSYELSAAAPEDKLNLLINQNVALGMPDEDFIDMQEPNPAQSSQDSHWFVDRNISQALTRDGRVFAKVTSDNNCAASLTACATSNTGWQKTQENIQIMAMGSGGTYYVTKNNTILYSGAAHGYNYPPYNPGAYLPDSARIGAGPWNAGKFRFEAVGTLSGVPDAPKNVTATDGTLNNNVQITWDGVVGAGNYKLYVSDSKGLKGTYVKNIPDYQMSTMAWCDPALLPPAPEGQPAPTCDASYYVNAAAGNLMALYRDGRNLYFTVSSENVLGESTGNGQDVGYPNLPVASSSVEIRADYNGSGQATPIIVDPNQTDMHTVSITSQPLGAGTVTIDPVTNKMTFVSNADWTGSKTFTYMVTDKGGYTVEGTGTVRTACPNPELKQFQVAPYPAMATGSVTLTYTLPNCAKNTSLHIQLFDGTQPMGILADSNLTQYQKLPTGTDKTITINYNGLQPANFTADVTMADNVENARAQKKFALHLLDPSKAIYDLKADTWTPRAFIDPVNVTIESFGANFCSLTALESEARASLAPDQSLKCLVEWTQLPNGVVQKPGQGYPQLIGSAGSVGNHTIKWDVSVFRTNGEKVTFKNYTKTFAAAEPPLPDIQIRSSTDAVTNLFTVPASGGIGAKLYVDSMGAGVSTYYSIDGDTPITFDTPKGAATRFVEFRPGVLWSTKKVQIKSAYTAMPGVFNEKNIDVIVTPSDKMKLALDTPAVSLDNSTIPVSVRVGLPTNTGLSYDQNTQGKWMVRIAKFTENDSLVYLTEPVEMVNGRANVTVPATNTMLAPRLIAVASVVSPIEGFSYEIRSDSRTVPISKGSPLSGEVVANRSSAPAPAVVTFSAKMASKDDVTSLGASEFYMSTDDGVSWNKVSSEQEAAAFRMTRTLGLGKFLVKAVFTNKNSNAKSESAPITVTTFKMPVFSVAGATVAYPGTPINLTASFTETNGTVSGVQGAPIAETPVVVWEVEGQDTPLTGTGVAINSSETKMIKVTAKARSSAANPADLASWTTQRLTVKFTAPAAPKVTIVGPPVLEVGQSYTFEARVTEPWAPAKAALSMRGEWTLPNGRKVEGPTLNWAPVDADMSPTGEKMPLKYTAWVEGYADDGAVASGEFGVRVWKYVWPVWDLKVQQDTTYAPSVAKLDLVLDNRKLMSQYRSEPLTITWDLPGDAEVMKQKDGSAQLRLPTGKAYPVSITIADGRGNSSTVTKELLAIDAPAFNIDMKLSPSNAMWREPVSVNAKPAVTGGHPFDRIIGYSYSVNGTPVENRGGVARFLLENAGNHQVEVTVTSKMGATQTKTFPMVVVQNRAPSCDLTAKNSPTARTLSFSATCGDSDGKIVGYRWTVDGRPMSATGNRVTYAYTALSGSVPVEMEVRDDSGATTTISKVVSY